MRTVAMKVVDYIDRLGTIWVEGQLTQITMRPGTKTAFLVLRDPAADMSLNVSCAPELLRNAPIPLAEGSRVIVNGKLAYFPNRGALTLRITEIRPIGIGELLLRIERIRALLHAEGLFDARLKRPVPFLPDTVGLITGRASAAERDVLAVAQRRWPAVEFAVENVAVQGPTAVEQIIAALVRLDHDPRVSVIIVARGGGSVEDLLPFSDETLCRAVAAARTPVISAIGHEPDCPLIDSVADVRAATPTDAAKRAVPDVVTERAQLAQYRARAAHALRAWVERESRMLAQLRTRPVLADPARALSERAQEITSLRERARRALTAQLATETTHTRHLNRQLVALGPAATLARGYAVVQRIVPAAGGSDTHVVRTVSDAPAGAQLRIRLADGAVTAASLGGPPSARPNRRTKPESQDT